MLVQEIYGKTNSQKSASECSKHLSSSDFRSCSVISNQSMTFLYKHNILSTLQFGFRKSESTKDEMALVVDNMKSFWLYWAWNTSR